MRLVLWLQYCRQRRWIIPLCAVRLSPPLTGANFEKKTSLRPCAHGFFAGRRSECVCSYTSIILRGKNPTRRRFRRKTKERDFCIFMAEFVASFLLGISGGISGVCAAVRKKIFRLGSIPTRDIPVCIMIFARSKYTNNKWIWSQKRPKTDHPSKKTFGSRTATSSVSASATKNIFQDQFLGNFLKEKKAFQTSTFLVNSVPAAAAIQLPALLPKKSPSFLRSNECEQNPDDTWITKISTFSFFPVNVRHFSRQWTNMGIRESRMSYYELDLFFPRSQFEILLLHPG